MRKTKQSNYLPPRIDERQLFPAKILCLSGESLYGFESTGGVIDGEANSASEGYGSIDNGSY